LARRPQASGSPRAGMRDVTSRLPPAITCAPRRYRSRDDGWLDRTGLRRSRGRRMTSTSPAVSLVSLVVVPITARSAKNLHTCSVVGHWLEPRATAWPCRRSRHPVASDALRCCCSVSTNSRRYGDADVANRNLCPSGIVHRRGNRARSHAEGIGTVIWATGYRRQYRGCVPVLDGRGEIPHRRRPPAGCTVLECSFSDNATRISSTASADALAQSGDCRSTWAIFVVGG
jgi:hypothetical protein